MATPIQSPFPPGPPPLKRKTSPLVWVLVGLAAFAFLVVLVVGAAGFFLVHKAKQAGLDGDLLKKNPGLAAAKMMVATNPDLEIVRVDDDRGVITVHNKKENKNYTVNMADAKNGKFVFQEDGKEAVTIEANGNGQNGAVKIHSSEGDMVMGAGASARIPAWVPVYPGSSPTGTFAMNNNEGSNGLFTFKTADSPAKVMAYYQDAVAKAGLKVTTSGTNTTEGNTGGGLTATDEGEKRTVSLAVSSDGKETTGVLTVTEKK